MKILHVIHSMDPRSGGPSNALRQLAQAQRAQGHDVCILCTDVQSAEPWQGREDFRERVSADLTAAGVEVFVARGSGRRGALRRWRYSSEARHWIIARVRDHPPDIVHIHGLFSHLTTSAARACRSASVPYVLRPAGGLNKFSRRQGNSAGKNLLFRFFARRDLLSARFIQATSARERSELLTLLPLTRIEVLPHGVTVPTELETNRGRAAFASAFPRIASRRYILYLSRIDAKKRLDRLIRAFALLPPACEDVALLVAGSDAGFRAQTEQLARHLDVDQRVFFTGFVEGDIKCGAFAGASFFALVSEDENFGVAAVEAMAHGIPVLLSDGVDAHEFADRAGAGITVRGEDSEIAAAMQRLLTTDGSAMGQRGRNFVAEQLTWFRVADRLAELYITD